MTLSKRKYKLAICLTVLYLFLPQLRLSIPDFPFNFFLQVMWWIPQFLSFVCLGLILWQEHKGGLRWFQADKAINYLYLYYALAILFNLFFPLFLL